jgi:uncharacterized membrane protein YqiK
MTLKQLVIRFKLFLEAVEKYEDSLAATLFEKRMMANDSDKNYFVEKILDEVSDRWAQPGYELTPLEIEALELILKAGMVIRTSAPGRF